MPSVAAVSPPATRRTRSCKACHVSVIVASVTAGAVRTGVDFALLPKAVLEGTVADSGTHPLEGVTVYGDSDTGFHVQAKTDATGAFSLGQWLSPLVVTFFSLRLGGFLPSLSVASRARSDDGSLRLLLRARDGALIEAVLIPAWISSLNRDTSSRL